MLSMAKLTPEFWGEAVLTAVHIINRSPSSSLNFKIPEELWTGGKKTSYEHLCVFLCEAYAHVPKQLCHKLDPKSHKYICIGYGANGEMGYHLWYPNSRKVIRSSHVIFNESKMHKQPIKEIEYRRIQFEDVASEQTQSSSDAPTSQVQDTTIAPEQAESKQSGTKTLYASITCAPAV